jgi:hypothetical protein
VKALTAKVEASIVALDGCLAKIKDFAKANRSWPRRPCVR